MQHLIEKAEILIGALPYIRKFYKKTFVIKYGGAAQNKDALKDSFARDVVLLNYIGINTVIVHGGGPKISATMEKLGKKPVFVDGHRVTDEETMDIVEMVLGGLINKEIVSLINRHGGWAVGLSGKDGMLIKAQKKMLKRALRTDESEDRESPAFVDLGLVGEVLEINPSILSTLEGGDFIPVIAPIGVSANGESLNINADSVASSVAGALKAEKLILLTDVPGILDKEGKVLSTLKKQEVTTYTASGVISGGMLPKVNACLESLDKGVVKTI